MLFSTPEQASGSAGPAPGEPRFVAPPPTRSALLAAAHALCLSRDARYLVAPIVGPCVIPGPLAGAAGAAAAAAPSESCHRLLDAQGRLWSLRADLTAPFARHAAAEGLRWVRRFDVSSVWTPATATGTAAGGGGGGATAMAAGARAATGGGDGGYTEWVCPLPSLPSPSRLPSFRARLMHRLLRNCKIFCTLHSSQYIAPLAQPF